MKKIYLITLLSICSISLFSSSKPQETELFMFISKHNVQYDEIEPYLTFKNHLKKNDFFDLEPLRLQKDYSHIETMNHYHYNQIKPAPFFNTNLILVNKQFYLNKDFIPSNLIVIPDTLNHANDNIMIQTLVLTQYSNMVSDLKLDDLYLFSGYRDYYKQEALYRYYQDDNYSAKPGFSEHQTGLAVDISRKDIGLTSLFKDTYEYQVLIKNCFKYGFILRYPENKQNHTGYYYEPWHFRYVGKIHAKYIMNNNLTLEEYLYANFEF